MALPQITLVRLDTKIKQLENRLKIYESSVLGVIGRCDDLQKQVESDIAYLEEEKIDKDHDRLTQLSKNVLSLTKNLLKIMENFGYSYQEYQEEDENENTNENDNMNENHRE
jgi:hypothetical protein